MKNVILAIILLTFSLSVRGSELYTDQAVLDINQDKIAASVKFNSPETGDMPVATTLDGKLWFLSQTLGWTPQGEYPLFSIDARILPPGNYPLYQVVTVPNGDPLSVANWIGGLQGLNFAGSRTWRL